MKHYGLSELYCQLCGNHNAEMETVESFRDEKVYVSAYCHSCGKHSMITITVLMLNQLLFSRNRLVYESQCKISDRSDELNKLQEELNDRCLERAMMGSIIHRMFWICQVVAKQHKSLYESISVLQDDVKNLKKSSSRKDALIKKYMLMYDADVFGELRRLRDRERLNSEIISTYVSDRAELGKIISILLVKMDVFKKTKAGLVSDVLDKSGQIVELTERIKSLSLDLANEKVKVHEIRERQDRIMSPMYRVAYVLMMILSRCSLAFNMVLTTSLLVFNRKRTGGVTFDNISLSMYRDTINFALQEDGWVLEEEDRRILRMELSELNDLMEDSGIPASGE